MHGTMNLKFMVVGWLIIFWVRDHMAPVHLRFLTGPLCPISIKGSIDPLIDLMVVHNLSCRYLSHGSGNMYHAIISVIPPFFTVHLQYLTLLLFSVTLIHSQLHPYIGLATPLYLLVQWIYLHFCCLDYTASIGVSCFLVFLWTHTHSGYKLPWTSVFINKNNTKRHNHTDFSSRIRETLTVSLSTPFSTALHSYMSLCVKRQISCQSHSAWYGLWQPNHDT
jgi:hypothetical protein